MRAIAALLIPGILSPGVASSQVLRGVVTERVSGVPLRGVLVSVASVPDSLRPGGIRHTMTNTRGEFAVRLSSGGQYVVAAKRIGITRYRSDILTLREGETSQLEIVLDRFEQRLPTVNVVDVDLCFRRNANRGQIVALWDEVRTALIATGVSREEQMLTGHLTKYVRTLEPGSLRILDDRRTVSEGYFERPMRSISGDSLAKFGYWGSEDGETLVFHAPDEEVLLSTAFRSGHCFELIAGRDAIRGLVGLGFRPRPPHLKGGIEGTLWIDAGNFELRFVDFKYTNLITIPRSQHLGGQVHYDQHPSGAWLVRRWFIRMPVFPEDVTRGGKGSRPILWRLLEEGGGLYTPGLRSWEAPGTITGIVTDSTGEAPLRGTIVSLSGTPFSTEVDSLGRFRFDSVAPGAYTLLAAHRSYADYGQLADDEPLMLEAGKVHRASLRAISTTQLRTMLCDAARVATPLFSEPAPIPAHSATVHVLLTRPDSGSTLPGVPIWLRWRDTTKKAGPDTLALLIEKDKQVGPILKGIDGLQDRLQGIQSGTDENGGATFCGLPVETMLELVMLRAADGPGADRVVPIASFTLRKGEVALRTFQVSPPK